LKDAVINFREYGIPRVASFPDGEIRLSFRLIAAKPPSDPFYFCIWWILSNPWTSCFHLFSHLFALKRVRDSRRLVTMFILFSFLSYSAFLSGSFYWCRIIIQGTVYIKGLRELFRSLSEKDFSSFYGFACALADI